MASSMHVIYSETIQGCGIISGSGFPGFLDFYQDDEGKPLYNQSASEYEQRNQVQKHWYDGWNKDHVLNALDRMSEQNLIDDKSNLQGKPVYVESGSEDIFGENMNIAAFKFHNFTTSVKRWDQTKRNHVLSTDFKKKGWLPASEQDCDYTNWDMFFNNKGVVNCGYDTVGNMLQYIHTHTRTDKFEMKPKNSDSLDWQEKGILKKFNQYEFFPDEISLFDQTGLDMYGYVYYPFTCIDEFETNCNLHVAFHGCG